MLRYMVLFFITVVRANLNYPVIEINSGIIEGRYIQSEIINKSYYAFQGIPYAEPPIGNLRFQPPVKPKPWTGILKTNQDGSICLQGSGGSENCLFLNVFTPSLPSDENDSSLLPVMVFIHGGAFVIGSPMTDLYGPEYLIDKNVVLVTIQYRLNIFGFLNALDESAPGNVGLKDQLAALEWVQENIEEFNGNPKQVTIFGHSAGSASVQYHLQSKLSKGLFHRAILQSGSTLNNWAFENNPIDVIYKLGKVLNIDSKNISLIVDKLRTLPAEELFEASNNEDLLDNKHRLIRFRFIPSIEYESPKAVITEDSYSVLSENKINTVPIMTGYVSNEGLIFIGKKYGVSDFQDYEKDPTILVPKALNILGDANKQQLVLEEIRKQYFDGVSFTNKTAFVNFKSDEAFVRGIRKSLEFLKSQNDVYFYVFDYTDEKSSSEYPGVAHIGELKYLFNTGVPETEQDKKVRENMATLWTNFAKTGNPTPIEDSKLDSIKWPTVSKLDKKKTNYLYIGKQLEIRENPGEENFEFWEKIFEQYGNPPFYLY